MRKFVVFTVLFLFLASGVTFATGQNDIKSVDKIELEDLKSKIKSDFTIFLRELYDEGQTREQETNRVINEIEQVLKDSTSLIDESKLELNKISHVQNKNLLIANIFLWISITVFTIMNLIFANNLKKELYFLRNGLLRGEIKENMIILNEQINILNGKLDLINKKE
jgi:hypothetical protein